MDGQKEYSHTIFSLIFKGKSLILFQTRIESFFELSGLSGALHISTHLIFITTLRGSCHFIGGKKMMS